MCTYHCQIGLWDWRRHGRFAGGLPISTASLHHCSRVLRHLQWAHNCTTLVQIIGSAGRDAFLLLSYREERFSELLKHHWCLVQVAIHPLWSRHSVYVSLTVVIFLLSSVKTLSFPLHAGVRFLWNWYSSIDLEFPLHIQKWCPDFRGWYVIGKQSKPPTCVNGPIYISNLLGTIHTVMLYVSYNFMHVLNCFLKKWPIGMARWVLSTY